jgi:plasmid stabilization system protein ParE
VARRVVWSRKARQELADIYHFIKLDDKRAAQALTDKIRSLTKALPEHPRIGRVVPEVGREDVRERIHGNYRILYQLVGEKIRILHVFHSAQEELPDL